MMTSQGILRLMQACGYSADERSWEWMNRLCPQGEALVETAPSENGEVAGHYGVWPKLLCCGGATLRVGMAVHAAVHPGHRGLEVLHGLMERVVLRCRQEGIPFLYGFPNERIWLVYLRFFKWQAMDDRTALELPLSGWRQPKADGAGAGVRCRLSESPRFDAEHGEIHEAMTRQGALRGWVGAVKDRAWLDWRYARRPRVCYPMIEARSSGGELLGYVILKQYERAGVRHGHLVDFAIRPSQEQVFPSLVHAALGWFKEQGLDVASCWMPEGTRPAQDLAGTGFRPTGFSTHLGILRIEGQDVPPAFLSGRWHVVMGDSDAF